MDQPAALQADYCDLKFIKGRKVCQIVLEIPIEAAGRFVKLFGTPLPDRSVPVALVRLNQEATEKPGDGRNDGEAEQDKRRQTRSQRAYWRCQEPTFRRFLVERYGITDPDMATADAVRLVCKVQSRSEFDSHPGAAAAWDALDSRYLAWLKAPEVV